MIGYEIINNFLVLTNDSIGFEYDIKEVKLFKSLLIILLDVPENSKIDDNIYAVSLRGKISWKVQMPEKKGFFKKKYIPFKEINLTNDNGIIGINYKGESYAIDPLRGYSQKI